MLSSSDGKMASCSVYKEITKKSVLCPHGTCPWSSPFPIVVGGLLHVSDSYICSSLTKVGSCAHLVFCLCLCVSNNELLRP